jgi:hypothetical protein
VVWCGVVWCGVFSCVVLCCVVLHYVMLCCVVLYFIYVFNALKWCYSIWKLPAPAYIQSVLVIFHKSRFLNSYKPFVTFLIRYNIYRRPPNPANGRPALGCCLSPGDLVGIKEFCSVLFHQVKFVIWRVEDNVLRMRSNKFNYARWKTVIKFHIAHKMIS